MEHAGTSYIGITTKMERYCARFALILEVLRYTCGQSDLTSISAQSMKDAFKLTYYFIAGAQKALNVRTHLQRLDQDSHLQKTRLRNLRKTLQIIIKSYPFALSALSALFTNSPNHKMQRMQPGYINPNLYDYICRKKHGKRYGIHRIL